MPKRKGKRISEGESDVIGERDMCKLRKLLRQNNEKEPTLSNRRQVNTTKDNDSESEASEPEIVPIDVEDSEFPEEYKADWEKFFPTSDGSKEFISEMQKNIAEARSKISEELSEFTGSIPGDLADFKGVDDLEQLPEEMVNHIRLLSDVLRHYRSGPLPKTLKMLPHLPGWEGLLDLLKPLEWTAHVYPKITKVFASKGREPALYFYETCLLPKVKQDIEENRCLSVHLLEALIASMFRPEEFVSGVFLPWIQSEMSKTEGVILSHLMKKATLKARFAAVALALALEEEFSIPRSLVVESLIGKRYHMPETALTRIKQYFFSFNNKDCTVYCTHENRMPLTWFRSLLTFVESYRSSISPEDRAQLVELCRCHEHPQITPEIRSLLMLIPTEHGSRSKECT